MAKTRQDIKTGRLLVIGGAEDPDEGNMTDGRVSHTIAPQRGYSETLAVTDSMVHVLADGYGFNLQTKRPILLDGEEIPIEHVGVA